jgi:HEAT repeat protein
MGAVGHPDAIKDLVPLLQDQVNEVQLAAAMALSVIHSSEALEALVLSLTEGSEAVRQAVAESLAVLPEEGHPVLYDAMTHNDMLVRRAATFGLRRVGTRWAIDSLYIAFIEDSQWYVRSAAQQAFFDLQKGEHRSPQAYPAIETIPWLGAWAGARGENMPAGPAAVHVLEKALIDGEPEVRALAARAIGQLGEVGSLKALYTALRDRQEEVRAAAHRSLGDLEMKIGQSLPAPV